MTCTWCRPPWPGGETETGTGGCSHCRSSCVPDGLAWSVSCDGLMAGRGFSIRGSAFAVSCKRSRSLLTFPSHSSSALQNTPNLKLGHWDIREQHLLLYPQHLYTCSAVGCVDKKPLPANLSRLDPASSVHQNIHTLSSMRQNFSWAASSLSPLSFLYYTLMVTSRHC